MNIFLLMLPVILIVLTGYICKIFSVLNKESGEHLTQFSFYIAIPCQIFYILSKTPFSQVVNFHYILAYAFCVIFTGSIIFFISTCVLKKSLSESSLNIMGSSMTNTAYFAIPLFVLLFNNPVPVISILLFQLSIMTTVILTIIERNKNEFSSKSVFFIIVKNPIIVSSLLGIFFSFYQVNLPYFFNQFLSILGASASPLILFSLGQSLHSDLKRIAKIEWIEIAMLIITKLLLLPMMAFFIGKYIFMLTPFWLSSLIIMSAMPTPNNMFIFALKYKLDVKKASTVVSITTVLSFITLNLLFVFFRPIS